MAMLDSHEHSRPARDFDGLIEIRANPVPRYFAILFYALVIWGLLFMGYFLLSGWSSEEEFARKMAAHQQQTEAGRGGGSGGTPAAAAVAADPQQLRAEGEKLYAQNCAACHGAGGEGGIGPALTAERYQYGKDLPSVQASIAQGRPGGMPAFGNQLPAAQVEALAHYVRSLGR